MEHRPIKSTRQQPPPEEAGCERAPPVNVTEAAARRLAAADARAKQARSVQVDGIEVYQGVAFRDEIKPVYLKLARFCLRHGITNLERYVKAQYHYSVFGENDPTVGKVMSVNRFDTQTCLDRFVRYDSRATQRLQQKLSSYSLEFKCCVNEAKVTYPKHTDKQLWNLVLMNKMLDLPALFRYCIAVAERMDEPIKEFQAAAFAQFMSDPIGYVAAWGDSVPVDLIAAAEGTILVKLR